MALPSDGMKSYESAVNALNDLQSNAATLEKIQLKKTKDGSLSEMFQFLERVNLKLEDIDKLNIIHVSGTKGKGSTCAFTENILRSRGFKTGFYSSPHIIEVRERIRINGKPLSKDLFAEYFWDCHNPLIQSKNTHDGSMPAYFRFLTLMAFHVFIQEKVDVAIIEVGIGGQYDCTNVIGNPVVCGVSSLGIDHTNVLGDTIEQIAWNKAGIFKKGVPAVTVPQKPEAMMVLKNRAHEIGAPLYLAPIEEVSGLGLGIQGTMQRHNAALAVQLSSFWLRNYFKGLNERIEEHTAILSNASELPLDCEQTSIDSKVLEGLASCHWPGRCQKHVHEGVSFYLDGAHTEESIRVCTDWYLSSLRHKQNETSSLRVLWFNATGDRQPEVLLKGLQRCNFHCAIFTPNIQRHNSNSSDLTNKKATTDSQLRRCLTNRNEWLKLQQSTGEEIKTYSNGYSKLKHFGDEPLDGSMTYGEERFPTLIFRSIEDALNWLKENNHRNLHVLCTGSLHLVGGVLSLIDPGICDR